MNKPHWIEATPADEESVFALMRAFYAEERIVLRADAARAALHEMLRDPRLGRVFLLKDPAEPAGAPGGYIALAFWHSLECGGRVAVLDELYLAPAFRGLGRKSVEFVREWAGRNGAVAVRLEVNHHNKRAKELYLKAGFGDDRRDIMTAML